MTGFYATQSGMITTLMSTAVGNRVTKSIDEVRFFSQNHAFHGRKRLMRAEELRGRGSSGRRH